MLKKLLFLSAVAAGCSFANETVPYPGVEPGKALESQPEEKEWLSNRVLEFVWDSPKAQAGLQAFPRFELINKEQKPSAGLVSGDVPFSLTLESEAGCHSCSVFGNIVLWKGAMPAKANQRPGCWLAYSGVNEEAGVLVEWRVELQDGAHYVKHRCTIEALKDIKLVGLSLINLKGDGFAVSGTVPGSPLVHEATHTFYGIEQPVAEAAVKPGEASIGFECSLPMKAGESYSFAAVSGIYPEGQLRRGFLAYLERERANPYHQFLHYNGWYDHGLSPTEEKMLATVKAYGEELVRKRGIKLDSFVLDDGWDDYHVALWQPSPEKFPNGFGKLAEAIRGIDSHFGIWISPLGGYSGNKERTEHARSMGLIPEGQEQLDLSCPGYYKWYLDRCKELMEHDGVNFFKWDRAGGGVSPHFMALLHIAAELRKENPGLFLSTTVGTWPSPFWLNYVDCIWRTGSSDINWIGEGNSREQYITYRDAACYRLIVKKAPLFPLNSLMHHGIVLGKAFQGRRTSDARPYVGGKAQEPQAKDGDCMTDTTVRTVDFPVNNDLKRDARIFFASGTNLQELYLSPDMMDEKAWDDVAEAIRWAQRYEDVLPDVHWVGGDPEKGEVYGYAAWRPGRGATLALRNPAGRKQAFRVRLNEALESAGVETLPAAFADQRIPDAREGMAIELEPFEVLVFSKRLDAPAALGKEKAGNPGK